MSILSATAFAGGSTYAQAMKLRAAAQAEAADRKQEIEADKAQALSSPRMSAPETQKRQARAKVQQLIEWLKIVKKLYAQDPKGMAKALAQVFKDLKAAVKAFRDAGGQEMAMSGSAVGAAMAGGASSAATPDDKTGEGDAAESDVPATEAQAAEAQGLDPDMRQPDPAETEAKTAGASLYDAVVGEVRKAIGEDGLEFLKEVRGLTNAITDLLSTARGQAAIRRQDKDMVKTFEEADKALKALHEEMDGMEQDIRREAPTAGMRLSIAA
jgi:hypothetical protein